MQFVSQFLKKNPLHCVLFSLIFNWGYFRGWAVLPDEIFLKVLGWQIIDHLTTGPHSCRAVSVTFNFLFFIYVFCLQFHSILECPFLAELSRKSRVIEVICECNENPHRNHSAHTMSVVMWALLWFYSKLAELWFLV